MSNFMTVVTERCVRYTHGRNMIQYILLRYVDDWRRDGDNICISVIKTITITQMLSNECHKVV